MGGRLPRLRADSPNPRSDVCFGVLRCHPPLNQRSFEIIAGAWRYRAAQMAEVNRVPVRIVNLTDAEALEAQLIETFSPFQRARLASLQNPLCYPRR